ncbi:LptF/LptG family permease [Candidatus Pelagibacter sp.]|uniref:LptF/LptG family permease n=1 Tax=Candidatus Pelagibacter sp. TaxID=2024849 RepID=UPI003D1419CB
MKKIIFRKILFDCLRFFLISLLGIASIIWVFQAVNFLDIMIEDGRNYNIYLNYSLLNFPKILSKVIPFCIFFSFSYIFINYETNNELIIYWNHGINKMNLINFFLIFSFFVLIIQIILLTTIVPKSEEISRNLIRNSNVDYFEGLIKPKKFNDNLKDLTIYAEDKNSDEEFINIYIKKKTSNNKFQIIYAKKGIFENKGKKKILVLYDGHNLNSNKNKITNFEFSKSDFSLADVDSHSISYRKLQEHSTKNLLKCIQNVYYKSNKQLSNCNINNPREVYKELFKRIILPFYLPLLILISSINLLNSKESINYNKKKILIFLFGICIITVSESSLGFVRNSIVYNIILILIPIITVLLIYGSIFYFFRSSKYKNIT